MLETYVLLKGGASSERNVSLWTAATITESLGRLGVHFVEIDALDQDWLEKIIALAPRCVVISLHGPFGEDGTVQKLLEEQSIKYSGSTSLVSALAIDKQATKKMVAQLEIAVPYSENTVLHGIPSWEGEYPVVVKPNKEGSSFGVVIAKDKNEMKAAVQAAFQYGQDVLLEEYIEGKELSCGVINLFGKIQALPLIEIKPKQGFFDFSAKYTAALCEEVCPANLEKSITEKIQGQSAHIFEYLNISQYARIDWILKEGKPYFLEINTLPGMTKTSLINKELAVAGIPFDLFIKHLISVQMYILLK